MRIGIDIDDTLTNSTKQVRKYISKYGHLYCDKDELLNLEEELIRGTFKSDLINRFFTNHSIEISDSIKLKKHAKKIVNKLHEEGNEIIIITARADNYYKDAYTYCSNYLKKKGIHFDKLITQQVYKFKTCKNEGIDIMIDDAVDTCEDVEKLGMKSLLFNSIINKDKQTTCKRINSWDEVYDYINNLKK